MILEEKFFKLWQYKKKKVKESKNYINLNANNRGKIGVSFSLCVYSVEFLLPVIGSWFLVVKDLEAQI